MRTVLLVAAAALTVTEPALAQDAVNSQTSAPGAPVASPPQGTGTPQPNVPGATGTVQAAPAPGQQEANRPATTTSPAASTTSPSAATPSATGIGATPALVPPTAGAAFYDVQGKKAGTIKAMSGNFITLSTPRGEARVAANGVAPGPNGPVVGLTAEQLDAAVTQANASRKQATAKSSKARKKRTR